MSSLLSQNVPPDPKTAEAFIIPEEYKSVRIFEREEDFLHFDKTEDGRRIVIFTTKKNLELLVRDKFLVVVVSTFKVSPSILTQLYTVHGAFMGKFLPLVFVLLSQKDELTIACDLKISTHYLYPNTTYIPVC